MRRDAWSEALYHIRNAPTYLLWLVIVAVGAVLVFTFFIWVLGMLALIISLALVYWASGARIEIKENDVVTGHLKWFTYTPVDGSPGRTAPWR